MRRFFVPPELSRDDVFELPEREARHAVQVLRLSVDDELTVLDGAGGVLSCVVQAATKRTLRVAVRDRQHRPPLPCAITLIQAIPKGPAFETIVQKATELGVARITPLLSERVVAHVSEKDSAAKVEKWRQIAIESIKQCGSPWLPVIESPMRFEKLAGQFSAGAADQGRARHSVRAADVTDERRARSDAPHLAELSLVCSLEESRRTLREVAEEFIATHSQPPSSALIWIGPEGDFTPAEYAAIGNTGAAAITLGPLVLRADTAAIACLAVANHELQTNFES